MKKYPVLNIKPIRGKYKLLLLTTIFMFLIFTGCASSQKNQHNLHRRPASKSQKDCGCQLMPVESQTIQTYQLLTYALQA